MGDGALHKRLADHRSEPHDNETLAAYADDTLKHQRRSAIDACLDTHPQARTFVRTAKHSASLLRQAFATPVTAATPGRCDHGDTRKRDPSG